MEQHSKTELELLRAEAKNLFVNNGLFAKEVAAKIGVTEATMSNWVNKYGWNGLKKTEKILKKVNAQKLYIEHGYTAKQVCQEIGITEKTMGDWVNRYNWKVARQSKIDNDLTVILNQNDKATNHQVIEIRDLFKKLDLIGQQVCDTSFEDITNITYQKAQSMLYVLHQLDLPPIELTIKKVTS